LDSHVFDRSVTGADVYFALLDFVILLRFCFYPQLGSPRVLDREFFKLIYNDYFVACLETMDGFINFTFPVNTNMTTPIFFI